MNIGELSRLTNLPSKTIRYYESVGLLPEPDRSPSGYRRYGSSDVERLRFVQRSRNLGFSVEEVRRLLDLWRDRDRASSDVKALAAQHLEDIDRKIQELRSMRKTLTDLVDACHGDNRPDCPILNDLAGTKCCND